MKKKKKKNKSTFACKGVSTAKFSELLFVSIHVEINQKRETLVGFLERNVQSTCGELASLTRTKIACIV